MIPTQEMINFPVFAENGKKIQPDTAKYSQGFQEADVLPAEWMNFLENKSSAAITTLNAGISSIEEELNAIVDAGGMTPSVNDNTQLLKAIKLIAQTLNSASSTKLKNERNFVVKDFDETNEGTSVKFDGTEDVSLNLPKNIKANFEGDLNGSASKFGGYTPTEFLNLVSASLPIEVKNNIEISKPLNVNYIVTGDNVVITLKSGSFLGQKININFIKKGSITQIINGEVMSETSSIGQNCNFMWNGTFWNYIDTNSTGDIKPAVGTSPQIGWLLCDGREVSKATYSSLYAVIGDDYGVASDTSKFKLPDLRGRFLQGADGNLGKYIEAGLPNIIGTTTPTILRFSDSMTGALQSYGWGDRRCLSQTDNPHYVGGLKFNAALGETKADGTLKSASEYHVFGKSDTVQPPACTINYLIRY